MDQAQNYANGPVSGKCALEYCNTYPDLKNAFYDDKECATKSQAEVVLTTGINMELTKVENLISSMYHSSFCC